MSKNTVRNEQTVLVVLVLVLVILAPVLVALVAQEGPYDIKAVLFPKGESIETCNEFVKQELTNPLSADFKGFAGMGGDSFEMPGDEWWVSSHVDTKNVFGTTNRIGFKCKMKWVEHDYGVGPRGSWELIDLDLTDLGVK